MTKFIEFYLPKNDCINISNFVYQEKSKWSKDLKNVKSITSGFNPNYQFLHDIGDYCCEKILPENTDFKKWKKTHWWINFYEKGHYAVPHHHMPEEYSMIMIVKPSTNNCLKFVYDDKEHVVQEKQGLSLIFTSSIEHSVDPVESDRISIAMDFKQK
tara:strand:- start:660 stop:1130 length:471 start_codon:yes stop_codon:yes gene_type:complete